MYALGRVGEDFGGAGEVEDVGAREEEDGYLVDLFAHCGGGCEYLWHFGRLAGSD